MSHNCTLNMHLLISADPQCVKEQTQNAAHISARLTMVLQDGIAMFGGSNCIMTLAILSYVTKSKHKMQHI